MGSHLGTGQSSGLALSEQGEPTGRRPMLGGLGRPFPATLAPPGLTELDSSKLFAEIRPADNLATPALKAWTVHKGKEEVELQKARHQSQELMRPDGGAYALEAAAGAVAGGGLPDGGKGRGRGSSRGRGLMSPGDP